VRLDGAPVNLSEFTEIVPGKTFTAIYTPPDEKIDATNVFSVAQGSYSDLFDNPGLVSSATNVQIDTVGKSIFGTVDSDVLIGSEGADRISGVPQSGQGAGKGSTDLLYGLGGADTFVLGTQTSEFYNDGNANSTGLRDYAFIVDFSKTEGDKIEVKTDTYFFSALSIGKLAGTGLYLDTNNSGSWDAKDELIGFLVGVTPGSVSGAQDLIMI
jgi:hypothetical protein